MKTKTDLDQIVKQGYSLDFGKTFDEIIDYFKKTFLLNGLVLLIVTLGIGIAVFFGLGIGSLLENFSDPTAVEALVGNTTFLIYYALFAIFLGVFLAPLNAGFIQLNRDIDTHNEVSISNIFKHYQSKHFLQIVGFTVIIQIISTVLGLIPFVGNILSIIVSWFTILGIPLIIFGNLNAIDALQYSVKLVSKNPWNILLIFIVASLISFLGILAICIGIFFTLPIVYSTAYVLYKNIVGFVEDDIIFDIEKDIENL